MIQLFGQLAAQMGHSYVEFRGKGFWSNDGLLVRWLRIMSLNMSEGGGGRLSWQYELRESWLRSAYSATGCVPSSLDEFLTDRERIETILDVSQRSIESLRAFGNFVPATTLNLVGGGGLALADFPIEWFERLSESFDHLLRGESTKHVSL